MVSLKEKVDEGLYRISRKCLGLEFIFGGFGLIAFSFDTITSNITGVVLVLLSILSWFVMMITWFNRNLVMKLFRESGYYE